MQPTQALRSTWRTVMERRPLIMTLVVLGWSIKNLVSLGLTHTTGPELYGVLVAALAVGAGFLNLALLTSPRTRTWATAAVLVLWAVVALGGIAGSVAHIIGPVAGHGPIDPRPRPIAAPLFFTALGLAGGFALFLGQRIRARRIRES
jgi:4-amino-4-deoxy-L-arabinose transferase-like glycosyltransferase